MRPVSMWEVGEKIGTGGYSSTETHDVVNWLTGENLIRMFDNSGRVVLTHQGIKEVEDARMSPDSSTDHFQPNTINNVLYNFGTMNNPAIQQGTSNSNQTITIYSRTKRIDYRINHTAKENNPTTT